MEYSKPHKAYEEQVEIFRSRGMECSDPVKAAAYLREVGYYRLTAYSYPMRKLLDPDSDRETSVQHRSPTFRPGYTFDDVIALYQFDRKLRMSALDGLQSLEIALRVHVAHILGRRDTFGHLNRGSLGRWADQDGSEPGRTRHDEWCEKYERQVREAKSEDFVTHFTEKYEGRIPVWVATEIMSFGSMIRLLGFMQNGDKNEVAKAFGFGNGARIHSPLVGLNTLRNTCAHHSRLWNRRIVQAVPKLDDAKVGDDLAHLSEITDTGRKKPYIYLAILAYMIRANDPQTRWPARLKDVVKKFPEIEGFSPEGDMGFPDGWVDLPLWRHG